MQTGSETAGGKSDQGGSSRADPEKEAAYWREQHAKQPYAKSCGRLRGGETGFSVAMGHGAPRGKRGLRQTGRRHRPARFGPRHTRFDLSGAKFFPPRRLLSSYDRPVTINFFARHGCPDPPAAP